MSITRELAEFVATTPFESLPEPVVERVKVHALDAFAAGFAGARWPWAQMVVELATELGGVSEASAFGQQRGWSVSQAALLNGVMISGFEADHSGHHSHTGATVTPAALAIAERKRVSGRELLTALALASEVGCRLGVAQTRAVEDERGFHNPGVNGPYSASAAAGRLLGLDGETQARAFGIAGSHSAGLVEFAWTGAMTKRLHLGRASQHGLESALLAAKGFTGPTTVIEGQYGMLNAFSPAPRPERALEGLGEQWLLTETLIKPYAAHGVTQAVIAAAVILKQDNTIDPETIERIHVTSTDHRVLLPRFLDPSPTNHLGAQCSLPFTTAVALFRDLDDPMEYDASVLDDRRIRNLANRVTFEYRTGPEGKRLVEGTGGQLELNVTADGKMVTAHTGPHIGSIPNPASFGDVEDKFHRFSRHVLGDGARALMVERIRTLEELADVGDLIAAVRG
ncbi:MULTISPECIES: MmgE/PrpD family protein [unclassified Mycobacterium]|uniref:MmgE/PrpD family protein n=1 Tax=unclassified Mycobacterium TaxID=2642494 RepID=UPI0029C95F38|nr:MULTISPECIES: MmgE/PrpD family protein [unclassified Mycobacterium]